MYLKELILENIDTWKYWYLKVLILESIDITYSFPCLHSSWKWQPLCTGSYEDMGQVFEYNRHRCQRNHNNQVPHCQISPQWLHFFHQNMIGRNLAALGQKWESKWFSWFYFNCSVTSSKSNLSIRTVGNTVRILSTESWKMFTQTKSFIMILQRPYFIYVISTIM